MEITNSNNNHVPREITGSGNSHEIEAIRRSLDALSPDMPAEALLEVQQKLHRLEDESERVVANTEGRAREILRPINEIQV